MIQLKDMNEILSTKQPIRLVYPTGESNIANIWNFENWKDCVVENVYSKNGELVIVESFVDMSINFCVSAKREWVEQNCPELLTKYKEFIRVEDEDEEVPYGNFGCPFLEWSENNIGIHQAIEKEDSQGYMYYSIDE